MSAATETAPFMVGDKVEVLVRHGNDRFYSPGVVVQTERLNPPVDFGREWLLHIAVDGCRLTCPVDYNGRNFPLPGVPAIVPAIEE